MTSNAVQELALLVNDGKIELPFEFPYIPWTIVRVLGYVKMIQNVYQQVAYDKEPERAKPLDHLFLHVKRIAAWFQLRREKN